MDQPRSDPPVGRDQLDDQLLQRLQRGYGVALEPLMERWGDAVISTCFRALRDARRACDLYAEVWAEVYVRMRFGTARRPESLGPWLVEIIGELLQQAAVDGGIPSAARHRIRLAPATPSAEELAKIELPTDETELRVARNPLPRAFSAAADLMLLQMPGPASINRIRPSAGAST
jgi:DNA-directed RNA polymerase specialized sigma24 family protein